MKQTGKFAPMLVLTVLFLAGVFCLPQKAQASNKKVGKGVIEMDTWSEETDSYDKADLDGDGKKDTLKTVRSSDHKTLKLYLNGKRIKTWKDHIPSMSIVTVKSVSYLELAITKATDGVEGESSGLYLIRSGKLKRMLNYQKLIKHNILEGNAFVYTGNAEDHVWATSVSGNKIYLHFSLGTKSLGQIHLDQVPLKVKNGKFTLLTSTAEASATIYDGEYGPYTSTGEKNPFTAAKKIKVYKSAGGSKVSFTIKKNKKFYITNCKIKNKKVYLKIKTTSGKTGWMPLSSSSKSLVKVRPFPIGG